MGPSPVDEGDRADKEEGDGHQHVAEDGDHRRVLDPITDLENAEAVFLYRCQKMFRHSSLDWRSGGRRMWLLFYLLIDLFILF
jgi:hypothetical protein